MNKISVEKFISEIKNKNSVIIDVRNFDEFSIESIPQSKNIPLSQIEAGHHHEIPKDEKVFLICQSGMRSSRACQILKASGFDQVISIEGGINHLHKKSDMVIKKLNTISIMRQVQIVAGFLILLGVILSHFINPYFIFLSGFVGAGLLFAGLSGFCGMAILLEKMPWNKGITCPMRKT